jgi:diacylglycerol kinase family enzyme
MARSIVILNASAGTLLDGAVPNPRDVVERAFAAAGRQADVVLCEPADLMRRITRAARSDYDEVIVGGGDGTVSYAVAHLAGTGKALGVIPLGTLNLLAGDFGMPARLEEAVAALAMAERQRMDLATINGRLFHTVSGIGFFSQMARAREAHRGILLGRWVAMGLATWRAISRMGRFELELDLEGERRAVEAHSVLVTNNCFVGGPRWRRELLDAGVLEVHIGHDASTLRRLLAGADVLTGRWRDNPAIETLAVRSLSIRSRRRPRLWVATDGEMFRETTPLRYAIRPKALSVLVPPTAPEKRSELQPEADVEPRPG